MRQCTQNLSGIFTRSASLSFPFIITLLSSGVLHAKSFTDVAERMVRNSLEALVNRDCALADLVMEEEKKVDAYRDKIFRVLLTYMMADPGTIERGLALILISRHLERVGDHATNIAEEVIYMVEGREVRHQYESKLRSVK